MGSDRLPGGVSGLATGHPSSKNEGATVQMKSPFFGTTNIKTRPPGAVQPSVVTPADKKCGSAPPKGRKLSGVSLPTWRVSTSSSASSSSGGNGNHSGAKTSSGNNKRGSLGTLNASSKSVVFKMKNFSNVFRKRFTGIPETAPVIAWKSVNIAYHSDSRLAGEIVDQLCEKCSLEQLNRARDPRLSLLAAPGSSFRESGVDHEARTPDAKCSAAAAAPLMAGRDSVTVTEDVDAVSVPPKLSKSATSSTNGSSVESDLGAGEDNLPNAVASAKKDHSHHGKKSRKRSAGGRAGGSSIISRLSFRRTGSGKALGRKASKLFVELSSRDIYEDARNSVLSAAELPQGRETYQSITVTLPPNPGPVVSDAETVDSTAQHHSQLQQRDNARLQQDQARSKGKVLVSCTPKLCGNWKDDADPYATLSLFLALRGVGTYLQFPVLFIVRRREKRSLFIESELVENLFIESEYAILCATTTRKPQTLDLLALTGPDLTNFVLWSRTVLLRSTPESILVFYHPEREEECRKIFPPEATFVALEEATTSHGSLKPVPAEVMHMTLQSSLTGVLQRENSSRRPS
ncbi:unnamed protein product, partial [Amoebophrya sp. A120]|eukprot:GSA120T00001986001.1